MKTLYILLICMTAALALNAQDTIVTIQFANTSTGVGAYYEQNISLQEGCADCPKSYKLYDGIRYTFFGGQVIGMSEFRRVAALVGELVGIRYDRSSADNQRILHAKLSGKQIDDIKSALGTGESGENNPTRATFAQDGGEVISVPMVGDIHLGGNDGASRGVDSMTNYVHVESIAQRLIYISDVDVIDAMPVIEGVDTMTFEPVAGVAPFVEFRWLIEVWGDWTTCGRAVDLRASRFAMTMAYKYGGYKDSPTQYVDGWNLIEEKQADFAFAHGHEVPFLGFDEGAYKKYYHWEAPKAKGRITMRAKKIPLHKISGKRKSNAWLASASRRACRKG